MLNTIAKLKYKFQISNVTEISPTTLKNYFKVKHNGLTCKQQLIFCYGHSVKTCKNISTEANRFGWGGVIVPLWSMYYYTNTSFFLLVALFILKYSMAHVIDMIADGMGKGMGKDGGKGEGERMQKATLFPSAYPTIPPIQFSCFQVQKYTVGSGMWAEKLS